jgi:hypothetical protein
MYLYLVILTFFVTLQSQAFQVSVGGHHTGFANLNAFYKSEKISFSDFMQHNIGFAVAAKYRFDDRYAFAISYQQSFHRTAISYSDRTDKNVGIEITSWTPSINYGWLNKKNDYLHLLFGLNFENYTYKLFEYEFNEALENSISFIFGLGVDMQISDEVPIGFSTDISIYYGKTNAKSYMISDDDIMILTLRAKASIFYAFGSIN